MLKRFLLCLFVLGIAGYADEDVLRPKGRPDQPPAPQAEGLVRNPWALGIEVGGSLSFFGQDITLHQSPDYQTNLTSGSGIGPMINIAADYALTDYVGLQARLGFDQKHYGTNGYYDAPCQQPIGSGNYVPARVDRSGSQTINYWTGGLALRYRFDERWVFIGGFTYHSRSSASFTTTDTVLTAGCEFFDDLGNPIGQRQQESGSNTASFNAIRWSLDLNIGYRVPLSENVVLLPRLGTQIFLSPLAPDDRTTGVHPVIGPVYSFTNRRLHAVVLALGLWFNL